jgi:hypothetical protein
MSHDDLINADAAREHLQWVNDGAAAALSHERRPGHLQLVSIHPDGGVSYSAFAIGDVEHQLEAALIDARAGRNVYIETRTVRPGRPKEREPERKPGRGRADATLGSFAIVIDSDADKGRAGRVDHLDGDASAIVETSPGNRHIWLLLRRALNATAAKRFGEMIRKSVAADANTGTVTQPYRVAGTPNFPDAKKRARGRVVVPTRLISISDKLWTPAEIEARFSTDGVQAASIQPARKPVRALKRTGRTRSTPRAIARVKRKLAAKVTAKTDRSAKFQSAVNAAVRAGMEPDQFEDLARQCPDGCAAKYLEDGDRLHVEVGRSWSKTEEPKETGPAPNVSIDGAELLDRIYEFKGRLICYPSKEAHVAHTLWVAHTHLMSAWETTPRLAFLSPEPASGKTRALEITELLVPRPVPAINVSPAYLVRKVQAEEGLPTILFDEIDAVFGPKAKEGNEDVRSLLNAGYRKGAVVGRCVMHGSVAIPEELPAFCAVALAGLNDLPDTVHSRAIIVKMRRRAPDEAIEPYRRREHEEEGHKLRDQLAVWAAAAASRITVPDMPDGIFDRNADIWEPLIAVADAAGNHWPETARATSVTLVTLSTEYGEERLGIRLLDDMRTIFDRDERLPTKTILERLRNLDEAPWADLENNKPLNDRGLASRLRAYSIKRHVIRVGSTQYKGYRREDFVDAWRRYLPPPSPPPETE